MTKKKRLDIRLSEKERQVLEFIAIQEELNLSEAARLVIREAAFNRGIAPLGKLTLDHAISKSISGRI